MENTHVNVVRSNEEILSGISDINDTTRRDVYQIDPKLLTVEEGHNVRDFDADRVKEHIESLATNIAENGVLTPLICRRENIGKNKNGDIVYKYVIVDGECRFRAVKSLENTENSIIRVPVVLERQTNNQADRIIDMLNANESLRFSPFELAEAYKKFILFGWTDVEIAKKLGKTLNHVRDTLDLGKYDESVLSAVKTKKVSATNIRHLDKKIKEEGVEDDHKRKKEVSSRLEKALLLAEEEGETIGKTGKLNVSKYLGINETIEERFVNAITLLFGYNKKNVSKKDAKTTLPALPERDVYTHAQLIEIAEDLEGGISLKNVINKHFGEPIADSKSTAVVDVDDSVAQNKTLTYLRMIEEGFEESLLDSESTFEEQEKMVEECS